MTSIPTLTTDRLVLRAFVQHDLEEYSAIMGDPEVTKYLGDGHPLSRNDAWRQMAMILGHWTLLGYGLWAVEERATGALLDSISTLLPDTQLFLYAYVRKEAVLSSRIEGTQSSLSDLLLFEIDEAPGVPLDDVVEVSNYVSALEHGLTRLRAGFPLSNRLVREIHGVLLSRGRGSGKHPGQFRRSQNWLGGTRPGNASYVPPPAHAVHDCMSGLERFFHDDNGPPVLVRVGLAHVQFETIHPFLDGNGRVGRLLITLLLCSAGVLSEPMLYLSLYLKENRSRYYDLLDGVRRTGDWEAWMAFFLDGVRETSEGAAATARRLTALFGADRERIVQAGRRAGSILRVHDALKARPLTSLPTVARQTRLTAPTVGVAMDALVRLGIARELTGRRRDRVFSYAAYLTILNEGAILASSELD